MANVDATLAERGNRYGDFAQHAQITQDLKDVFTGTPGWKKLSAPMKEGLEMVAHKVGRILNGDPTYTDSWHDIAGYAKLVEDHLIDQSHADAAIQADAQTSIADQIAHVKSGRVSSTGQNLQQIPRTAEEAAPAQTTFPVPPPAVDTSVQTVAPPVAPLNVTSPTAPVSPSVAPLKPVALPVAPLTVAPVNPVKTDK